MIAYFSFEVSWDGIGASYLFTESCKVSVGLQVGVAYEQIELNVFGYFILEDIFPRNPNYIIKLPEYKCNIRTNFGRKLMMSSCCNNPRTLISILHIADFYL